MALKPEVCQLSWTRQPRSCLLQIPSSSSLQVVPPWLYPVPDLVHVDQSPKNALMFVVTNKFKRKNAANVLLWQEVYNDVCIIDNYHCECHCYLSLKIHTYFTFHSHSLASHWTPETRRGRNTSPILVAPGEGWTVGFLGGQLVPCRGRFWTCKTWLPLVSKSCP